MGRKTKENLILQNLDVIREMKKKGCTDVQILKHIGVSPATFYKHLKVNKELQEAWNDAKAELASDLEGNLYKLAKGGFALTTTRTYTDKNGNIQTETIEKELPPNLGALIFLLKNIQPDKWSNDWQSVNLRKEELELKKKALENDW